jgi:hypothetical protein
VVGARALATRRSGLPLERRRLGTVARESSCRPCTRQSNLPGHAAGQGQPRRRAAGVPHPPAGGPTARRWRSTACSRLPATARRARERRVLRQLVHGHAGAHGRQRRRADGGRRGKLNPTGIHRTRRPRRHDAGGVVCVFVRHHKCPSVEPAPDRKRDFLRERHAEPYPSQPLARDRRISFRSLRGWLLGTGPAPRCCRRDPSVSAKLLA